ncbi:MAG: proline dehydrogenase family protein [Bacteroidales bacterium]
MTHFNNTKIAFQSKSNKDLKRAYFLFSSIKYPFVVKIGQILSALALKIHFPVNWLVKPTIYKQFCGGENIEECKPTVHKMAQYNVKSILDYSVEGKENDKDIQSALEETIRAIENAAKDPDVPFAVFKPTGFGKSAVLEKASSEQELSKEDMFELEKFKQRIHHLCKTAYDNGVAIMIDAEDFAYQKVIDVVVRENMKKFNKKQPVVFNTLQMYRWDRLDFLKTELQKAEEDNYFLGIKFVRGAYMEKERLRAKKYGYPDPIHKDKERTDQDYNKGLKFAIENIEKIAIFNGTHNENSSMYLTELMAQHGIAKNDERVYFSQLYGMSDHISFNLAHEGYNVAKYLPYGPVKNVLPYLIRRVEENSSVKGQTSRELGLIKKELHRRKTENII